MRIHLLALIFLVLVAHSLKADNICEDEGCPTLKIDNIDLQHTNERLDESLDMKVNHYDSKPKFKSDQKVDITIKNLKNPNNIKGNSLAEKEQKYKSNEFQEVKSPAGGDNKNSNIKFGFDIDLPNN